MDHVQIPITRMSPGAFPLPEYFSEGAAGMDLSAVLPAPEILAPGAFRLIPCGFAIALPPGFEAQIRPRSGLASKHGVTVLNAPGTIDSDYRGEVKVLLVNHGPEPFSVLPGMRVAQMVVARVARVAWSATDDLGATARGGGGFGHTGLQS
jgi:dUTP pyrophosphatase